MTRHTFFRTARAALLATVLLTPAAFAQGDSFRAQSDHGGFLASVWSFLSGFLAGGETLDTRCTIDPNGGGCGEAAAHPDNRCTIDPNGGGCEPGF